DADHYYPVVTCSIPGETTGEYVSQRTWGDYPPGMNHAFF
ncbi:hypothetical protein LCGC14_2886530, partial [marine sediment metagenome]